MQLVIKDGKVHATYDDNVDILKCYDLTQFEIIQWDGSGEFVAPPDSGDMPPDPRTPAQRQLGIKERYLRRRKRAYPKVQKMLLMIYRDMKNGTTEFVDVIDAIHDQFQPPE